ncbi:MAG: bifunctional hydroxymethylpyrimidine kinase/phosphomethylpyrimidine kinase [Acidimicrobiia bacterium]|nr:bifunctional hydroxymethylpyrimidine kinase/phosphomethylpyrimidine kinase [Acidimicrobiia bacterium]
MAIPKALTIAGSDSGGGAGVQADLKTFAAFGVYGCCVITAVTAQNTQGVSAIETVSPAMVRKQLESVLSDIRPEAMKTGMLANADIIQAIASSLRAAPRIPLVLDPVMRSKSGAALLSPDAVAALKELLIPLADLVTPNVPEAEALTGTGLSSDEDFEAAARQLHAMGARAVLLKGGHRPRVPADRDTAPGEVIDLLYDGQEFHPIRGRWVNTPHTHGTGCTLASAIAAGLAQGLELYPAVVKARAYLAKALEAAFAIGHGIGPVHHFHAWWAPRD